VKDTHSPNYLVRLAAVVALWRVNTEPQLVVPALASLLTDTNSLVRFSAANGIHHFGTNALSAVPALTLLLSDPVSDVRGAATTALMEIDPKAATNAPVSHYNPQYDLATDLIELNRAANSPHLYPQ
jgi:HEAT repeat protein